MEVKIYEPGDGSNLTGTIISISSMNKWRYVEGYIKSPTPVEYDDNGKILWTPYRIDGCFVSEEELKEYFSKENILLYRK